MSKGEVIKQGKRRKARFQKMYFVYDLCWNTHGYAQSKSMHSGCFHALTAETPSI